MKNRKLYYLIVTFALLCNNCKKPCTETWTIKGRLLNGTTLKPIKNVFFSASLYNVNSQGKARDITYVGKSITNDSGYFSIEYKCKEKIFEEIDFETLAPYGGYVRDNVLFEKQFNRTFYYATKGRVVVTLKPKKPLNGDTLFIEMSRGVLFAKDSFTNTFTGVWQDYSSKLGGIDVYAARSRSLLKAIKASSTTDYLENGWWTLPFGVTGDPVIDTIFVNY